MPSVEHRQAATLQAGDKLAQAGLVLPALLAVLLALLSGFANTDGYPEGITGCDVFAGIFIIPALVLSGLVLVAAAFVFPRRADRLSFAFFLVVVLAGCALALTLWQVPDWLFALQQERLFCS